MTYDEWKSTDTTDDGEDTAGHYPPCPADSGCPECSQDGGFVCGQAYILDEDMFKKWF